MNSIINRATLRLKYWLKC